MLINDIAFEVDEFVETERFRSITNRYLSSSGQENERLRTAILKYLKFSPESDLLINDFISLAVDSKSEGRLDAAIDVLNQLGRTILRYANEYLINDIKMWDLRFPGRAYEPNDEYWYVLLRSVGQCGAVPQDRLSFVKMCQTAADRGIVEAVVESLGDIGTTEAFREIEKFLSHDDQFIVGLAREILEAR